MCLHLFKLHIFQFHIQGQWWASVTLTTSLALLRSELWLDHCRTSGCKPVEGCIISVQGHWLLEDGPLGSWTVTLWAACSSSSVSCVHAFLSGKSTQIFQELLQAVDKIETMQIFPDPGVVLPGPVLGPTLLQPPNPACVEKDPGFQWWCYLCVCGMLNGLVFLSKDKLQVGIAYLRQHRPDRMKDRRFIQLKAKNSRPNNITCKFDQVQLAHLIFDWLQRVTGPGIDPFTLACFLQHTLTDIRKEAITVSPTIVGSNYFDFMYVSTISCHIQKGHVRAEICSSPCSSHITHRMMGTFSILWSAHRHL